MINEIKSTLKEIKRKSFKNLIYKEEIPCICSECKSNPKPFFHSIEFIKKRIENNLNSSPCNITGEDIAISELLGHISNENFDVLMNISKALKELQKDSKLNAEFNMVFGDAFLEINETILNIDGNTNKNPLSKLEQIYEKGKIGKDLVAIFGIPVDMLGKVEKLLKYIGDYKQMVS